MRGRLIIINLRVDAAGGISYLRGKCFFLLQACKGLSFFSAETLFFQNNKHKTCRVIEKDLPHINIACLFY